MHPLNVQHLFDGVNCVESGLEGCRSELLLQEGFVAQNCFRMFCQIVFAKTGGLRGMLVRVREEIAIDPPTDGSTPNSL